MLSRQLLSSLEFSPGEMDVVENALMVLARTRVLLLSIESAEKQIIGGFNKEDVGALTERIIAHREQSRSMRGLHELGNEIRREKGEKT